MVNAMAKCALIGGGLSDAISDEVVTVGAVSQECTNFGPGRVVADGRSFCEDVEVGGGCTTAYFDVKVFDTEGVDEGL